MENFGREMFDKYYIQATRINDLVNEFNSSYANLQGNELDRLDLFYAYRSTTYLYTKLIRLLTSKDLWAPFMHLTFIAETGVPLTTDFDNEKTFLANVITFIAGNETEIIKILDVLVEKDKQDLKYSFDNFLVDADIAARAFKRIKDSWN